MRLKKEQDNSEQLAHKQARCEAWDNIFFGLSIAGTIFLLVGGFLFVGVMSVNQTLWIFGGALVWIVFFFTLSEHFDYKARCYQNEIRDRDQ